MFSKISGDVLREGSDGVRVIKIEQSIRVGQVGWSHVELCWGVGLNSQIFYIYKYHIMVSYG